MLRHIRHDLSVLEKGYLISYEGEEALHHIHKDITNCGSYYSGFG